MIKIWGRNTSSNVQKAMWAVGELKLEHERIDVGGAFGKEQRARLSGDESERSRPHARGRRRLPALGIEFDRALSRGQARQKRRARTQRRKAARDREPMDGLAAVGAGTDHHTGLLGPDPDAGGKARHGRDQDVAGENHRRDENARCADWARPSMSRGPLSPTATFLSASCAIASCTLCRSGRR